MTMYLFDSPHKNRQRSVCTFSWNSVLSKDQDSEQISRPFLFSKRIRLTLSRIATFIWVQKAAYWQNQPFRFNKWNKCLILLFVFLFTHRCEYFISIELQEHSMKRVYACVVFLLSLFFSYNYCFVTVMQYVFVEYVWCWSTNLSTIWMCFRLFDIVYCKMRFLIDELNCVANFYCLHLISSLGKRNGFPHSNEFCLHIF